MHIESVTRIVCVFGWGIAGFHLGVFLRNAVHTFNAVLKCADENDANHN